MKLSYRRLADAFGNKGGLAGADDGTHRHPPHRRAARASSPNSSSPEAAESEPSAAASQPLPLPRSVLHVYHVGRSPTTGYAAPFVRWASRASEIFYSWRNKTSPLPPMRRRSLFGDSHVPPSPKPSTASRGAPAQKPFTPCFPGDAWAHTPTPQKPFIKWTHGDPRGAPSPKPFTASHGAPAQKPFIPCFPGDPQVHAPSGPSQNPFIKWTHGDPRAHTPMLPALANKGAPPLAPPPPPQSNQDASHPPSPAEGFHGFLAQLAFAALVIMGVRDGLDDLLSGWAKALKVIFVLSLIVGAGTLAAGLMATSPVVSTGYTRTVLSTSARFCTCLAAFVLIVDLSVLMGSHGYIAGVLLGLVAVLFSVSVWIQGEPAAYGVYMRARNGTKHLCRCFKWFRQRGPILPT